MYRSDRLLSHIHRLRAQASAELHSAQSIPLPSLGDFAEQVSPFPLYKWQKEFLSTAAKKAVLVASRQSGKSYIAGLLCIYEALCRGKTLSLAVAPTMRQSMLLLLHAKTVFAAAYARGLTDIRIINESKTAIELDNESRLISLPGSSGATIRGYSRPDRITIDEAGYVDSSLLITTLRPMLAVNPDAGFLLIGTPNGSMGPFYEAAHSDEFKVWKIPAAVIPTISKKFLKRELFTLGQALFDQEYNCQFLQRHGAVINAKDIEYLFAPFKRAWKEESDD